MNRFLFFLGVVCASCFILNVFLLLGLGIVFRDAQFGRDVYEFFDVLSEGRLTGSFFVAVSQIGVLWLCSGVGRWRRYNRLEHPVDEYIGGSGKN